MVITDLKLFLMPHRFLLLRIDTDQGVSGWGEPIVEGRARTVAAAVEEWRHYLIGQDPALIERHWQTMYRGAFYRGGPVLMSAIAGIDQALWDIKGKALGVPVHQLLGGPVRERVKVYRSIHGDTPAQLADDAALAVQQGYTLIKSSAVPATHFVDSLASIDQVVSFFGAVRDRVGYSVDLAIDFHGRIHRPMAKPLVRALAEFRLAFIEEPVLPTNKEALREIAQVSNAPIALGERLYSRWDFKEILRDGYVDIIQPDLSHAGGISECRRLADLAEAFDVAFAPHCPLSSIAFAACIQTDAGAETAVFQEQSLDVHDASDSNQCLRFLSDPQVFRYANGFVLLPTGPGLGLEPRQDLVDEMSQAGHDWKNPLWHAFDGTPIEW